MLVHRNTLDYFLLLVFSLVVAMIPWPAIFKSVYGYAMIDREVYSEYFLFGRSVLEYKEFSGIVSYYTNEFLWHFGISTLLSEGFELSSVFACISVFVYFTFGYIVLRDNSPWALFFLINPLVIDFAFSQLRLALAICLLIWAYLLRDRLRFFAAGVLFFALFIHSAIVIFLFIFFVVKAIDWCGRYFDVGVLGKFSILFLAGLLISLVIGPFREAILSAIGDRRAEYSDMSSTFLYSLFWIFLLFAMFLSAPRFIANVFHRYAIVILSIVSVNAIHGGYSTRFLAAAFPFLICSVLEFRNRGVVVVWLFAIYAAVQWLYWLKII